VVGHPVTLLLFRARHDLLDDCVDMKAGYALLTSLIRETLTP
jgi:hypothetical protein